MRSHLGTRRVPARNMYEGLVIMEGCVKVDIVKATEGARLTDTDDADADNNRMQAVGVEPGSKGFQCACPRAVP